VRWFSNNTDLSARAVAMAPTDADKSDASSGDPDCCECQGREECIADPDDNNRR
jgi:hypothetical protein